MPLEPRISVVSPRLDTKPWGGRKLGGFGLELPEGESIGEALITAGEALVTSGFRAGETLANIVSDDPHASLGAVASASIGGRNLFPLLVKLIDARENLSIQVHPNDAEAVALDRLGKTEAWHVLAADPGAVLYLGVQPGVEFDDFRTAAARQDGSSARLMRTIPARAGTTVIIPAGTIHALGAGVMVYEVQQPSDITYRLDDWGRVDAHGRRRELHLDAGFAVSVPGNMPELILAVSLRPTIGEHHVLVACRYFSLERIALPVGGSRGIGNSGSPSVVTVIAGEATILDKTLPTGTSAVVWPTLASATLTATQPLLVLVAHVPDLAPDVVQRASRAGADPRAVSALGGATDDVVAAMRA